MDKFDIKGKWNEMKGKVKESHADLIDDDLEYEEGQDDKLLARLQQKLDKGKDELIHWLR